MRERRGSRSRACGRPHVVRCGSQRHRCADASLQWKAALMDSDAEGAKRVWHRRVRKKGCGGPAAYCPGCPGCGDCAGSSCRASQRAEQRSGGRQAEGTWKHARADVAAREEALRPRRCRLPRRMLRASRARARCGPGRQAARAPGRGRGRRPCGRTGASRPGTRRGRSSCGPRTPAPAATPRRWRSSRPPS